MTVQCTLRVLSARSQMVLLLLLSAIGFSCLVRPMVSQNVFSRVISLIKASPGQKNNYFRE